MVRRYFSLKPVTAVTIEPNLHNGCSTGDLMISTTQDLRVFLGIKQIAPREAADLPRLLPPGSCRLHCGIRRNKSHIRVDKLGILGLELSAV